MSSSDQERRSANFSSSIWGDFFETLLMDKELTCYDAQIEVVKGKVKEMLMTTSTTVVEKISLINLIFRLGVSYHFESEIEEQLQHFFYHLNHNNDQYDLCTSALVFRVFRQHGFNMTSDRFKKFKNEDGKFKDDLVKDGWGMLGLYEASHLAIHGEEILDEALAFTLGHLKSLATNQANPRLAKHIANALEWPFHQCITRMSTRQFISLYEEDDSRNEDLLLFAKLDFNKLQLLHQHEISILASGGLLDLRVHPTPHISVSVQFSWYEDINLASKLAYARNRLMEAYFWSYGMNFEPQYSYSRIILAKVITMISIFDDTYDLYGTIEELHIFTKATQRWDYTCFEELPDYMKLIYGTLLNIFEEWEEELAKDGTSHVVCATYPKNAMKELARGYLVEAEWFNKGYVPSIEEYISNGLITSAYGPITMTSFLGLGQTAGCNEFEWLQHTACKSHTATRVMGRLMNDLVSHKDEQKRGDVASFIECYMKQNESLSSEKKAIKEIEKRIDKAWKDINEECLRPTQIPMHLLMSILNLARVTNVFYKHGDGYTTPECNLKLHIVSLLFDPIPLPNTNE